MSKDRTTPRTRGTPTPFDGLWVKKPSIKDKLEKQRREREQEQEPLPPSPLERITALEDEVQRLTDLTLELTTAITSLRQDIRDLWCR